MDSRVIKINPNRKQEFPYFAIQEGSNYIWFVKSKKRRAYCQAVFVSGNNNYLPFELECEVRLSELTKVDRMRLTFAIGNNDA